MKWCTEMYLQQEIDWLNNMIRQNKQDDASIAEMVAEAQNCVWWYEQDNDEDHLRKAEAYNTMAQSFRDNKYTIKQIREQRERVQWLRKIVRKTSSD